MSNEPNASGLVLRGIAHRRFNRPSNMSVPITHAMALIADIAVEHVHHLVDKTGTSIGDIEMHFMCSTTIDFPFSTRKVCWADVKRRLSKGGVCQSESLINAYECASWGYGLRFYLEGGHHKYIVFSIVDANIFDLDFWRYNQNWGHSGFGITTVFVQAGADANESIYVGSATTQNSLAEFASQVRRAARGKDDLIISLPFFPENIRATFRRVMRGSECLHDHHSELGHCFGADPWISILQRALSNETQQPERFLACSLALSGYFCMADISIVPDKLVLMAEGEMVLEVAS